MAEAPNPDRVRRAIAQRLSLRRPQEDALRILAEIAAKIDFKGASDLPALLATIRAEHPSIRASRASSEVFRRFASRSLRASARRA